MCRSVATVLPPTPAAEPPQTVTGQQSAGAQSASDQPPAEEVTPDPWPKIVKQEGATYTLYQPQLDNWDGYNFAAHAAVSVLPASAKDPDFGVIEITANTQVDRLSRTVHFSNIQVKKSTFPSTPAKAAAYQQGFQTMVAEGYSTMSLDRLQAMLAIEGAEKKARMIPVKNDPPKLVFTQKSAVLVSIEGEPVWRTVAGTSLERVINARALILLDDSSGKYYIHLFDGFVEAAKLFGPWTVSSSVPATAVNLATTLGKERIVDLMEGPADEKDPQNRLSLKTSVPEVVVATTPTELIVTEGPPDWAPLDGTMLIYVKNTTGNIFKDLNDQNTYVLVTGRWFRAPDLSGPWQYIPGANLPPDFAKIPDDSPKENVKASIPATPQAQEAVIANEIPQTATVYRGKAQFTPVINGAPDLKPIPDTSLMSVFNSPSPIIMVSQNEWYGVQDGVWFSASSVQGPWVVATSIPAAIYSIPPSSPLYYVTYVKLYDVTPQYVVAGYTPGYLGTVVAADGVVVYGTGYTYVPYIGATVWYPNADHLWLCGQSNLDSVDWLDDGLRLRLGHGCRVGFNLLLGLCCCALLGGDALWCLCSRSVWRCRSLGTRRLGGDHRRCLLSLGIDHSGQPGLSGLQRLDRQCLGQQGRNFVQLCDWTIVSWTTSWG
jgi:hypothetical protein